MAVQDDDRENQMRQVFGLSEPPSRSRSDVDAVFVIEGVTLPFELKSTTTRSFSTVRDLGPDHIEKWKTMHWVFAFYDPSAVSMLEAFYGSPSQMAPWVNKIGDYIQPDQLLAKEMAKRVDDAVVEEVIGKKDFFPVSDAERIMKRQWTKQEYIQNADSEEGYSLSSMRGLVAGRVEYLVSRGATLNNPHIPGAFVRALTPLSLGADSPESLRLAVLSAQNGGD